MSPRPSTGKKLAVIAGSGFGGLGGYFGVEKTVPFDRIGGVGACTVEGHRGEVLFCSVEDKKLVLVLGRRHVYEGAVEGMSRLIRWLGGEGIEDLVVLSAVGGVRRSLRPGDLVAVQGIINVQNLGKVFAGSRRGSGTGGVAGAVRERGSYQSRAPLSPRLTGAVEHAARKAGVRLSRGTLACFSGPAYETAAEVHALIAVGADMATMSSAPELLFAGREGMEIAVIGAVTNPATGIGRAPVDHGDVLEAARGKTGALARLLKQLVIDE